MGSKDALNLPIGSTFQKKWTVTLKLGQGGFGAVYKVQDSTRPEKFYALKIERTNMANSVLKMDTVVLLKMQGNKHLCKFQACGRDENINYLIMSLAGPNLEDLFEKSPSKKFSLSTVLQIGNQGMEALRDLHNAGFLHRDVKPANFALGRDHQARIIKLLDFGLARQYLTKDGQLRPPRKTLGFRGTERYASVNAHRYLELGRNDDLISLFYMMAEFHVGKLPWSEADSFELIGEVKEGPAIKEWNAVLPKKLMEIHENLLHLKYQHTPNYEWISAKFLELGTDNKLTLDEPFDWELTTRRDSATVIEESDYPYERQFHGEKSIKNRFQPSSGEPED